MSLREKFKEEPHLVQERALRMIHGLRQERSPAPSTSQDSGPSNVQTPIGTNSTTSPEVDQSASKAAWAGFKTLGGVLKASAGAFGPLKSAVGEISECVDIYERYAEGREDYETLRIELASLSADLAVFFKEPTPPVMTPSINNLAKDIQREVDFVKGKRQRSRLGRMAEAKDDADAVLECYRRIRGLLARIGVNANLHTWKTLDEMATDNRLKTLPCSLSATYQSSESANMREGCTPNTRIAVLIQLRAWAYDGNSKKIYWLNGMAGTGKTTIAYSLCDQLKDARKLAASFFCSRQLPECHNVNRILPTLCYQLALFSRPFRYAISRVLEEDPLVYNQSLRLQFDKLILEPLLEVKASLPADRVVVIDALDECENQNGVGQILDILLSHASNLPVKFFVTSRPEAEIHHRMLSRTGDRSQFELHLHDLERSIVREDIETYLQVKLACIELSAADLKILTDHSGALFIYASTVVRYVGAGNFSWGPQERLATMLTMPASSPDSSKSIDGLYGTILDLALNNRDLNQSNKTHMKLVLDTVICAQEPLTVPVLAGLLKLGGEQPVRNSLRSLLSVLHISDGDELVTTFHASFPDYVLSQARSVEFHCNKQEHNTKLAHLCFDFISSSDPPFNICKLESSYVYDDTVPGLDETIGKSISSTLFYTCRYWESHLKLAFPSHDLAKALSDFLSVRLLLWMEIMNLKRCMNNGARALGRVHAWIQSDSYSNDVRQLCRDAAAFATAFSSAPASRSTPHIYISMLPSWPVGRPVSQCYLGKAQGLVKVTGAAMARRESAPLAVYNVWNAVRSVAFSPDGSHVAVGCADSTIEVLDAHTGHLIGEPLEGHTDAANSVAYSNDSARIVSGSTDHTVRIWDAHTGQTIGESLRGHTDRVTSVAFSSDGARIASGSEDHTIRVWDAHTGLAVGAPLEGHTSDVESIAFSGDGARIVSGSLDDTIRIWDAGTGEMIGNPIQGHAEPVTSVVWSHDGLRIVSGSWDKTIRIWNAQTGQMIGNPLEGHTDWVRSVVCSDDGARVISGSRDKTIRIWDVQTGKMIGKPLEGDTGEIWSLSLSSDGARIVSGSDDGTIRIWDAHASTSMGEPLGEHTDVVTLFPLSSDTPPSVPGSDGTVRISDSRASQDMAAQLQAHTGSVSSVAYSSDSKRIVSGSADKTVRIWDADTGQMIGEPFEGHTYAVRSVACSSDATRIVSGSYDKTIRIWDAHTGQAIGKPLQGHTKLVLSVALSSDDTRIVSGSYDHSVRIWDATTGQGIGEPLTGHSGDVNSVAYSGDNRRIASGSIDTTIRIWDALTGQQIGEPFRGHTGAVLSIAFSTDATRIVSGSWDNTIRIWDANTGQAIGEPLRGHTEPVNSVSFSGDGVLIASGSDDQTIRIWDAYTGQSMGQPLRGHTRPVNSVAFSGDGVHIVSGSDDQTIRIWDIRTIPTIGPEFGGETVNLGHSDDLHSIWSVDEDGWAVSDGSDLLVWVPPDVRPGLLCPRNTAVISATGTARLDFIDSNIGGRWRQCYHPAMATCSAVG